MKRIVICLFLISSVVCASAQRPKKVVAKAKQPAATASAAGLKIFKQMLESTAKVMFIDSVVVDKSDFMAHVPLNGESGTIKINNHSSNIDEQFTSYQNEFGDRRIVANGDSTNSRLYTQTMLGDGWSKPAVIADFGSAEYPMQNYPFLAADGTTLFFSAKGNESMGGRDIFMSSFDSDEAKWYKPQNYGLPFNSTANDYLLAIDDLDTLGWLVTDRRQPEGKVCIYTFVPTQSRQNFDDEDLSDKELEAYARILSIKATWKFGNRNAAIARRDAMLKRQNEKRQVATMHFVVNDNKVITSPSQFKNSQSRKLYAQVVELRKMIDDTNDYLSSAREAWHNGDHRLKDAILKAEDTLEKQQNDLVSLEKKIRSLENNQ